MGQYCCPWLDPIALSTWNILILLNVNSSNVGLYKLLVTLNIAFEAAKAV